MRPDCQNRQPGIGSAGELKSVARLFDLAAIAYLELLTAGFPIFYRRSAEARRTLDDDGFLLSGFNVDQAPQKRSAFMVRAPVFDGAAFLRAEDVDPLGEDIVRQFTALQKGGCDEGRGQFDIRGRPMA